MMKSNKRFEAVLARVFKPGTTMESISKHPNAGKIKIALQRVIAAMESGDEIREEESLKELERLKTEVPKPEGDQNKLN